MSAGAIGARLWYAFTFQHREAQRLSGPDGRVHSPPTADFQWAPTVHKETQQTLEQGTVPYFEGPLPDKIYVAIVGKDPYPNAPTTIPFCKPNWAQQLRDNSSGKHVLNSLGIPLDSIAEHYASPLALFEALRQAGVVFLNRSYRPITGSLRKVRDEDALKKAYNINQRFLTEATVMLFCGEAKKMGWILPKASLPLSEDAVHPDVRNRANPKTKERWREIWGRRALAKKFNLRMDHLFER